MHVHIQIPVSKSRLYNQQHTEYSIHHTILNLRMTCGHRNSCIPHFYYHIHQLQLLLEFSFCFCNMTRIPLWNFQHQVSIFKHDKFMIKKSFSSNQLDGNHSYLNRTKWPCPIIKIGIKINPISFSIAAVKWVSIINSISTPAWWFSTYNLH